MKRLLTLTLFFGIVWGEDDPKVICQVDGFEMYYTGEMASGSLAGIYKCPSGHTRLYNSSFNEGKKQNQTTFPDLTPDITPMYNWIGNPTEAWKEDAKMERKKKEFEAWERMELAKMTAEQRNTYFELKRAAEKKRLDAIAAKEKAEQLEKERRLAAERKLRK